MNGRRRPRRGVSATDVTMRPYTDAEIEAYVETGDPLDKAGAYGIQDPQFAPVAVVGRLLFGRHGAAAWAGRGDAWAGPGSRRAE